MGSGHPLKVLAIDIGAEGHAGCARMGDRDIHPSIFVEVENVDATRRRQIRIAEERRSRKRTFTRIGIEGRRSSSARDDKIDRAVIVQVGKSRVAGRSMSGQSRWGGRVGKRLMPLLPPQNVGPESPAKGFPVINRSRSPSWS